MRLISYYFVGNIKKNEEINLIKITKQEAFKMRELGLGEDVHKSYSNHPTYYLTESRKSMKALSDYRKSKLAN